MSVETENARRRGPNRRPAAVYVVIAGAGTILGVFATRAGAEARAADARADRASADAIGSVVIRAHELE